jgi:electron transport complex protein RnfG
MKLYMKPIFTLAAICLVASLLLAGTNALTAPRIAAEEARVEREALQAVIPTATAFHKEDLGTDLPATVTAVYRAEGADGYVFRLETSGFSTGLKILCAIGSDGKVIGVRTLSHNETDGYGKYCETDAYVSQYTGADSSLLGIDGISGATKTTVAYENAIRDAFAAHAAVRAR